MYRNMNYLYLFLETICDNPDLNTTKEVISTNIEASIGLF